MFEEVTNVSDTQVEAEQAPAQALSRRSFLNTAALASIGTMAALAPQIASAQEDDDDDMEPGRTIPRGDINVLKFLAAAQAIFPEPTQFFSPNLPLVSVIRPGNTANAGALAAATGLAQSGLFAGQSQAFFDAVTALATRADRANRSYHRRRRNTFSTDLPI